MEPNAWLTSEDSKGLAQLEKTLTGFEATF